MAIKRIRVTNFKSFKDLEVALGKFNVLIGANASGKSNFIRIFEFLRDIVNMGWIMQFLCKGAVNISGI
jgi:predicted ATPase